MGLSKEQVERHIAGVEKRLGNTQERAHHGYEFARLCVEVKKHQEAIRYLTDYLSVQEKDFRAHKLMGQVCERDGDLEKAIVHFNRSLQLKRDQREVAMSVATLYCKIDNPPVEALKNCLKMIKPFGNVHSLVLTLNEKLLSIDGSVDRDMVTKLTEEQLELCKDDVATHIRLVEHYSSAGEMDKAMAHCQSQRKKQLFAESREWLMCALQIAEQRYMSEKSSTTDHITQCHTLILVLDHLSLLFQASRASGPQMAAVLLKYDRVLFAALQSLKAQQPHVLALQRVALRELCGQYYMMVASYMYWGHWFRSTLGRKQTLKHSQVGNLCLLASLSFPPPSLDSIPLPGGLKQRREVEAWHTRACKRLCVVTRQLLLVSKQKGDIYLGRLARFMEGQGGKLAIIRALFTENEDLRGIKVQFASSTIIYNIRSSYLAAESEHLMAQGSTLQLPSEDEAQLCDQVYVLFSSGDLSSLLWLCLCLRAMESTSPVFTWLPQLCPTLKAECQHRHIHISDVDTLTLCDVEAMLVLSTDVLQLSLTSPPSHPPSLSESLVHHLPITMSTTLDSAGMRKYRQWWSCVYQWLSGSVSTVDAAGVKQAISEGLALVRGCRPLRLSLGQLTSLAKHFQQRAEALVETRDSMAGDQLSSTPLIEALLKRSGHYWDILVDILTDKDSYRDIPKYRTSQSQTPRYEGGSDVMSQTPQKSKGAKVLQALSTEGEPDKVSLLNEARMALAAAAAYRGDTSRALSLYSRVKTAHAAWNQVQIYHVLASQTSPDRASQKVDHLRKTAETLELTLTRLNPSDKEFRGRIEEMQEEVKQLLSEEQRRQDIAISLHYDSSPESSLPLPRESSTPSVAAGREKQVSPFSLEKKSPSHLLNESLRAELREKNSLIMTMSEQLKSLQVEMSELKLHLSPVARHPHLPHPHTSLHTYHQASPQTLGSVPGQFLSPGVPGQFPSPGGVAMYPSHSSLVYSYGSPLVHQQSPMRMGMPTQPLVHSPLTYYAPLQQHLTPLPPHLSPSTRPTLSVLPPHPTIPSNPPLFRGQTVQASAPGPQQTVASASATDFVLRPGTFTQQLPPFNISSGAVSSTTDVVLGEQPLVNAGSGLSYMSSPEQQHYHQLQMKQQQQMQLGQHLQIQIKQQQLLEQQQFIPQQPRMPSLSVSQPGGPSLPVSSSSVLSQPDSSPAGFILKPGTFLSSSSQQQQQQDPSSFPVLQHSSPGNAVTSSSGPMPIAHTVSTQSPNLPSSMPVGKVGSQSLVSTLSSSGASILQPPFASSLPLSGGFQFSLKPSLDPSPTNFVERPPLATGTQPMSTQALTSLLKTSTIASTFAPSFGATTMTAATSSSSLGTLITPAVVSVTSQPRETKAAGESETRDDQDASYEVSPDFEPIVSLPELDHIRTGEEDEMVLFSHRAKLYRFDSDKNIWKDRGIGDMKILEHSKTGKARVLMRREQVLKLCCNHYITSEMSLTAVQGNKQLAWYTHCDFADAEAKAEKLAVKFKQADVAGEFRKVFEECVAKTKRKGEDSKDGQFSASLTTDSLKEKFSAPAGSWECDTCLVQNQPTSDKCVACGSDKPGSKKTTGQPSTLKPSSSLPADPLRARFAAPVGSWECDSCLVQNQPATSQCAACGTSKPDTQKTGSQIPPTSDSVPPITFSLPASISGDSTVPFKFGGPSNTEGLSLGKLSFSAPPVSFGESTENGGGFKLGGLTLGVAPTSTSEPEMAAESKNKEGITPEKIFHVTEPSSSAAADVGSGGLNFGNLFLGTQPTAADTGSGGFNFTAPTSTHTNSETAATLQPKTSFKPSFSTPSTADGLFQLGSAQPGAAPAADDVSGRSKPLISSEGGFKSKAAVSGSGARTEQSEGILTLEPFSFTSASKTNETPVGLNFGSLFNKSASTKAGGVGGLKPFLFGTSPDALELPTIPAPERDDSQNDSSAHEPDIHFEPIVTLPEAVDLKSGEENEDVLFAERAKLFRFDSSLKQWKERGVGDMKILVNRSSGKARVLMRRDQILKICCNHFITREMSLSPMSGSNKAWTWLTLCDFADETGKPEKLAARFKSPNVASAFKKAFEEAIEYASGERTSVIEGKKASDEPNSASVAESKGATDRNNQDQHEREEKEGEEGEEDGEEGEDDYEQEESEDRTALSLPLDLTARFGPQVGSWNCDSCYVTNQRDDEICCACGQPGPSDSQSRVVSTASSFTPQLFTSSSATVLTPQIQQQIKFGARLQITPRVSATPVAAKESSPKSEIDENQHSSSSRSSSHSPSPFTQHPASSWVELSASELQEEDDSDVVIVAVELPSEEKVKLAENYLLPPSFYNYETQPPCPGCRGCVDLLKGHYEHTPSADSADKESSNSRRDVAEEGEAGDMVKEEGKQSGLQPFAGSLSNFSFSSLAASATSGSGSEFWGQKGSKFSGFKGAGSQLFSAKPSSTEDEGDNPESEVDIHFKPIVTLEVVDTKTGEEGEECLFSHRAKLYRFDTKLEQWKERGVGDIKILKNTATGRSRVLMRRDQILKICCNHFITPDMKLEANISSQKSWTWKTLSDFAEETAKEEMFSIKFKHMEVAQKFGEIFKSCQVVSGHSSGSEPETRWSSERGRSESQGTGTQSKGSAEASTSSSTCNPLREMLASTGAFETGVEKQEVVKDDDIILRGGIAVEEDKEVDANDKEATSAAEGNDDSPPPSAPPEDGSPPPPAPPEEDGSPALLTTSLPHSQTTDTTPQLRLPLMPLNNSPLSVGSALRLPLTQPQRPTEPAVTETRPDVGSSSVDQPQSSQAGRSEVPVFGSTSATLSFAALASSGSTSDFPSFGQRPEGFQFANVDQKLFSSDAARDQDDPEREADIHFHPIISLSEAVKVKSWDEDADTVFCQRTKLYRFDSDTGQWKERGVGELKIMKHRRTGRVKLIMRRDQVLKICCNHSLTSDMTVTQMATNEKACVWFTSADYTDQVVRPEKLSAKFKTVQIANEFKETFERCRADILASIEDNQSEDVEWKGKVEQEGESGEGQEDGESGEGEEEGESGEGSEDEAGRKEEDSSGEVDTPQVPN